MPNDALFMALAQAQARPSKALRAVESGAQAGQDILGGYMQGKQVGQQLDQYKLLATPLGSMYPDPSQIPFGLSSQHTVKDLLTLAPAMENYVPSNLIRGAAGAYGANTTGGGSSSPTSTAPAPPNGGSVQTPGMSLDIPAGGMGMKGFQNVVLPALKAGQEERQFQQRQGAEQGRFDTGQANEESRFQRGQDLTRAGKEAELRKEFETSNTSVMSASDAYKQLNDAWNKVPPNQKGPGYGTFTSNLGDIASGRFPEAVAYNKARLQLAGAITAGIDPKGRQGPSLLEKILQGIPTLGQSEQTKNDLMGNINNQLSSQSNRNYEGYQAAAGSVGGSIPKPSLSQFQDRSLHQKALAWANQNPNDPRAKAIRDKAIGSLNQ